MSITWFAAAEEFPAWPVPDKDMPCRFMRVPPPFEHLVRQEREMDEKVGIIDIANKLLNEANEKFK